MVLQFTKTRNIKKQFDRIVSTEMFEAVGRRNWGIYFNKLKECITDKENNTANNNYI